LENHEATPVDSARPDRTRAPRVMASSGESSSDAPSSSSDDDDDDDARVSAPPVASSSSSSSRVVAASRASSSSSTKPSRQHQPRASRPSSRAKRKSKPAPIAVCLTNCKYELLRCVQKKLGWIEVGSDAEDWQLYWTDTSVSIERVMRLKATQKINHFTGMLEICRKKQLAKNLARMSALFPSEFKFAPKTWTLPLELESFLDQFPRKASKPGKRTFILKPDAGCQGKGIALAQSQDHVLKALENINVDVEGESKGSNAVVAQRYLSKPFLIDGYKFDLRVYALVICADPLRVFVFNDGLARFCTEKYEPPGKGNLKDTCMHLTNYAVNKHNENFVFNDDAGANGAGSKWSVQGLKDWMEDNGHDFVGAWEGIVDLIVKTIVSVQPVLAHNYHSVLPPETNDGYSCFEILGVDVMLDENLR
jgi:tubulin polyglutamylase TTLL6/13